MSVKVTVMAIIYYYHFDQVFSTICLTMVNEAWGAFHSRKRCQQLRTFANNFKWNELFAATVGERWQL